MDDVGPAPEDPLPGDDVPGSDEPPAEDAGGMELAGGVLDCRGDEPGPELCEGAELSPTDEPPLELETVELELTVADEPLLLPLLDDDPELDPEEEWEDDDEQQP